MKVYVYAFFIIKVIWMKFRKVDEKKREEDIAIDWSVKVTNEKE